MFEVDPSTISGKDTLQLLSELELNLNAKIRAMANLWEIIPEYKSMEGELTRKKKEREMKERERVEKLADEANW